MFEQVKKFLLITTLFFTHTLFAQDTLQQAITRKKHIWAATAISVAGYGGSLIALSNAWYRNYPRSSFHFFNDNSDWLQLDKAGHVFSAYTAGRYSAELWRWAGLPEKQRIWVGGLSGTAFTTVIEVLDGFSSGWGFSLGDLGADIAGSGIFIAQELTWKEQRIQVKFSFHRNDYGEKSLNQRADELFGQRTLERMLKDYNGQTYWASANLRSFFKKSRMPGWLNIAVGYGASGMFGGTENIARDKNGLISFDRSDIPRRRHWYLAPDVDLTRIRTKSRFLRTAFFLLQSFKFPTPSLGFSQEGVEWNWLHF